jgi:glucose dehydrogenase
LPIIAGVVFLAGEWVPAWLGMSIAFLVAGLGVAGLGWWVLRGDSRNRAAENEAEQAAVVEAKHDEVHH